MRPLADVALISCRDDLARDRDLLLREALSRRGLRSRTVVWDDPSVPWETFPLTVIRSTWDYHVHRDDFLAWTERVDSCSALWNPKQVVRWNTHKEYLRDLSEAGVPIVPSVWLPQGADVSMHALRKERAWSRMVAKPAISASAEGLVGLEDDVAGEERLLSLLRRGDTIVQPYVESVATVGEISVVLVDGRVTHAIRKRPGPGDFRVQRRYGGSVERHEPSSAESSLATECLEAAGVETLYARVDLVVGDRDDLLVGELEVVEPELYLPFSPPAAEFLAAAIAIRIGA